jgi:hypothetical protein
VYVTVVGWPCSGSAHLTVLDFDAPKVWVCHLGKGAGLQVDLVGLTLVAVIKQLHCSGGLGIGAGL